MRNRNLVSFFSGLVLAISTLVFPPALPAQTAPPPGVPDLSGVWLGREKGSKFPSKEPPSLQAWAQKKYEENNSRPRTEIDPVPTRCFPPGSTRIMITPEPFEILQLPGRMIMMFEYNHMVRRIYMDGRGHPNEDELNATWMGNSIGRWDGDTLVIDTIGFNDKTWLDLSGIPHSDALHVVERLRKVDPKTLQINFTFTDPKTLTKPWEAQKIYKLQPGWDIEELACADNYYNDPGQAGK